MTPRELIECVRTMSHTERHELNALLTMPSPEQVFASMGWNLSEGNQVVALPRFRCNFSSSDDMEYWRERECPAFLPPSGEQ